jgi:hypothetical protein
MSTNNHPRMREYEGVHFEDKIVEVPIPEHRGDLGLASLGLELVGDPDPSSVLKCDTCEMEFSDSETGRDELLWHLKQCGG